MSNMRRPWLPSVFALTVLLVLLGPLVFSQQPVAAVPRRNITSRDLTRAQMEQFLTNARIVGERPAPKGITHTRRLVLTDGKWTHDAHVQDIDVYKAEVRTKDGIEKNFRDSYKFNIAAYRVDKMMDLGIVPACVPREVDGKPAAVDWWVDDVQSTKRRRRAAGRAPDGNDWSRQLNIIRDSTSLSSMRIATREIY